MDRRTFISLTGAASSWLLSVTRVSSADRHPTNSVNVSAHGAVGDGTTNDLKAVLAAWERALLTGGTLVFEPKIYNLGAMESRPIFSTAKVNGIRVNGFGATLKLQSVGKATPVGFQLRNCSDCIIEGVNWMDTGAELSTVLGPYGLTAFQLVAGNGEQSERFTIRECSTNGANVFFQATGDQQAQSGKAGAISDIRIEACKAVRTFYGISTHNLGDRLVADLECMNVGRAYFPYGATNHDVRIRVSHDSSIVPGADACCLLASDWRDIDGVRLSLYLNGFGGRWGNCVAFNALSVPDAGKRTLRDVNVFVSTRGLTAGKMPTPFAFRSYVEGKLQPSGDQQFIDVTLEVDEVSSGTEPIAIYSTQSTPQPLNVGPSLWRLLENGRKQVPGFHLRLQR